MADQPSEVEILVHITAPSRTTDDETYRQLARAYLAFQPESRISITRSTPSQSSWQPPPSQISDSYPLPRADIINVTPTRIFQRHLLRNLSSSPSSSSSSKAKPPGPSNNSGIEVVDVPSSTPVPPSQQHGSSTPMESSNPPSKVIPVTPLPLAGLHKRAFAVEEEGRDKHHVDDFDVTHISSSFVSVPASSSSFSRAGSEPPLPLLKRTRHAISASDNADHVTRSSSDTAPIRSSDHSAVYRIASTLNIRPPSPPVDILNLDLASLVSEELEKLAHDLSSRYKPVLRRSIDPFERGFWLVDCTSWADATRLDTWVFLTNYLKSGLAGWGVWCSRDKLHDWIRFYCWGHVAKHVYLLTYLASGRQVKATGARWFDAGGELVIEVLPAASGPRQSSQRENLSVTS